MAISQWARIERRNNERLRLVAQESYTELASDVIVRSPVDKGLFRNNWMSALNSPDTSTTESKSRKGFGEPGGARFTEFLHISTRFDIGDDLFLTNSLPYARRLEFGHSRRMAPQGIVRIATAQWPLIITRIANRIR
jgi:hypothetical protein